MHYTIGLDYGTNTVRALLVNVEMVKKYQQMFGNMKRAKME